MTESESNVADFFNVIGHELVRVKESSNKTPDFSITTSKQKIFIEVKEITENQDEKLSNSKLEENGAVFGAIPDECIDEYTLGQRFRNPIKEANKQFKAACRNNEASLTVIQDIRSFANSSSCPQEEIKLAMFGDHVTCCLLIGSHSTSPSASISFAALYPTT